MLTIHWNPLCKSYENTLSIIYEKSFPRNRVCQEVKKWKKGFVKKLRDSQSSKMKERFCEKALW
jgi:hypothetical protein